MEYIKRNLSSLPQIISLLSILFLLGSLWYLNLHYSFFGINIFTYISLSDALTLFIDKIPKMTLISLFSIGMFFGIQFIFENLLKKIFELPTDSREVKRKKLFPMAISSFIVGIIPLLLFMVFIPVWFKSSYRNYEFVILKGAIVLFQIYWFVHLGLSFPKHLSSLKNFSQDSMLITIVLIFFCVIYYNHRVEVARISEKDYVNDFHEPKYRIRLKNNEVITTKDSVYMLGATNNYIFLLYSTNLSYTTRTRIIKMENVQELENEQIVPWYRPYP